MTYSDKILLEAERQWLEMVARRVDLEPAVSLQRRLITRSLALGTVVDSTRPAHLQLDDTDVARKLREKTPFLLGEPVALANAETDSFILGFCEDLAGGAAGAPAERLRATLEDGAINLGSLLKASIGRHQDAIRLKAHHIGVSPDLLWLVAELTAGPIVHRFQRDQLRRSPPGHRQVEDAVTVWGQGFCPACGSWPAFSERLTGAGGDSTLRCSFCGCGWQWPGDWCIYCSHAGDSLITAMVDSDRIGHGLELCRLCGGYLKSLVVETVTPFELLPVEDLGSNDLDVSATEKGYARPSMRQFAAADDMPCPPLDAA